MTCFDGIQEKRTQVPPLFKTSILNCHPCGTYCFFTICSGADNNQREKILAPKSPRMWDKLSQWGWAWGRAKAPGILPVQTLKTQSCWAIALGEPTGCAAECYPLALLAQKLSRNGNQVPQVSYSDYKPWRWLRAPYVSCSSRGWSAREKEERHEYESQTDVDNSQLQVHVVPMRLWVFVSLQKLTSVLLGLSGGDFRRY